MNTYAQIPASAVPSLIRMLKCSNNADLRKAGEELKERHVGDPGTNDLEIIGPDAEEYYGDND